ncbi:hypothetical protein BDP27DRAFT_1042124 [Rhodocollybia butyracea]|uniref:Uncharacterized protein n=1 Tax=Rhodocollybia butyracea TaxID=206335 RepID=A0A9P5Q549_9AGAR|nr:hypothetical protein BDP27DRAFT_1042124 [Rhodocollybia butyracea]
MLLRSGAILQKLTLRDIPSRVAVSFIESHPTIAELTICGSFSKHTYSGRFGALISCLTPVTQTHQGSNTLNVIAPSMAILNLELVVEQGTVPSPMLVFVEDVCALVENRALTPLGSNIARLSFVKVQPGLRSRGYSIRNIFPAIHNRLAPLQEASGLVLKFLPPKV